MRTQTITLTAAFLASILALFSTAHATTYVEARGYTGSERCLVGADSFGQSGEIGKTCTGGGTFDGQTSIVDLIIDDIGGGLAWERVSDPDDSFFTYLSAGGLTTQVQGRARYAGYSNRFGATLLNGDYHELIGATTNNRVLLSDCTGVTGCSTITSGFTELDAVIPGLSSGDIWKPTIDVRGQGNTFYTSLASDNFNGLDHMVAFKTVDPTNDPNDDGFEAFRYILGFEDLPTLGDLDYNDFVIEILFSAVTTVPAPGALALFGIGLFGVAGLRRKRG